MGRYQPHIKEYYRPATTEEAVRILTENRDTAAALAGGTSLTLRAPSRVKILVDLQGLGLDKVNRGSLGSMATMRSLEKALGDFWDGVIARAASAVGSRLVRNAATLGGELAAGLPWCDMPVLFSVMDGSASVVDEQGDREVSLESWAYKRPSEILEGGLITRVTVREKDEGEGIGFYKVMRVQGEYALAVAAAYVRLLEGKVEDIRVAAGAVSPHPVRLEYLEEDLKGLDVKDLDLERATQVILERFQAVSDPRVTREYRVEATRVAVKRAIREAITNATEKG